MEPARPRVGAPNPSTYVAMRPRASVLRPMYWFHLHKLGDIYLLGLLEGLTGTQGRILHGTWTPEQTTWALITLICQDATGGPLTVVRQRVKDAEIGKSIGM